MKLFVYLDRISLVHKLVSCKRTGSPNELARRLGIGRSTLYELIDELKSRGAPILYSKSLRTFYYETPYEVSIECSFKELRPEEAEIIEGGHFFFQSPFFPDGSKIALQTNQ